MKAYIITEKGLKLSCKISNYSKLDTPIETELVFTTSTTGYQEAITDPSYKYQSLVFTNPLIGNYGINYNNSESTQVHLDVVIINEENISTSHHKSELDLASFLKINDTPLISDVNTRQLVKHLRDHGQMRALISLEKIDYYDFNFKKDHIKSVSTQKRVHIPGKKQTVAIIDFGVKKSIIDSLKEHELNIYLFPYNCSIDEIKEVDPEAIVLSNGPGDPTQMSSELEKIKNLQELYPLLGICMGHQVFALANGAKTRKMLFGNRGSNQPVKDIAKDKVFITSQNHGYEVTRESLDKTQLEMTQFNLNDQSIEALRHESLRAISYQYHPEANPGPNDTKFIFNEFIELITGVQDA